MYGAHPAAPRDLNRLFPPTTHQMSSGLLRYRSAPSSILGEVCEDFLPVRPSSPETETMFARFLTPDPGDEIRNKPPMALSRCGAGGGQRSSQFPPRSPHPPQPASAAAVSQMMYQHRQQHHHQPQQQIQNQNQMVASSMAMDSDQLKNGGGNLIRHSSSPAGLFAHLNVENGYGVMRGIGGFRNGNEGGGGGIGTENRLKSQLSFSSRQSSGGLMSHISEMENESMEGYPMASWEESPMLSGNSFSSGLRRPRHNQTDSQNEGVRNGLSHQFSLPKTSSEIAAIEKFLHFQDSIPCKIRAKRGCATHPRSIAERVRRTRISERMRKLQELVPNMDKQTNTSDMLDLAVDYIKDLQKQVKRLSDSRANCTCSSTKQKPYTNPTV